ncbi:MAG: ASPIC/UnbV domain-containing protein, partial [Bryobacteraceae bacterium]
EEARILRNPCEGVGNWLKIDIPRPGTRVRAGTQWWHATTAVGYGSSYAGPLHFGLGAATHIDLEVFWPDGRRTRMDVPANRRIPVTP